MNSTWHSKDFLSLKYSVVVVLQLYLVYIWGLTINNYCPRNSPKKAKKNPLTSYNLFLYSSTDNWTSSASGGTTSYPIFLSSVGLWNLLTYGCLSACSAVNLLSGLNFVNFFNKSIASSDTSGSISSNDLRGLQHKTLLQSEGAVGMEVRSLLLFFVTHTLNVYLFVKQCGIGNIAFKMFRAVHNHQHFLLWTKQS